MRQDLNTVGIGMMLNNLQSSEKIGVEV